MGLEKATAQMEEPSTAEILSPNGEPDVRGPLKLLVGYDGRSGSRDALALARALGERTEAEMTVACVRPYRLQALGPESLSMITEEDESWIDRGAGQVLDPLPFSAKAIAGSQAATGLKELAEAEGSEMIILGSTHRGRPGRVFPGSIGEHVLDGAPCAVAIAPRGLADAGISIRKIAVGYDGSAASVTALRKAVELAERTRASLLILGAVEILLGLAGFETRQPKNLQEAQMEHHLRRAREGVPPTVSCESRLLVGEPAKAIVEAANEADLLMLGSRGSYRPARRLELGSVGAAVTRNAPSPTLITPTAW